MLWAAAVFLAPATAIAQSLPAGCGPGGVGTAATSPFAWAMINDRCMDLSRWINVTTTGKIWSLSTPVLTVGAGTVQVHGTLNADPFITFGATTTNLTAGPTTFAFLFGTPIVPGFYTNATSTGGVTVTDGARGNTTVSTSGLFPTYISGYGTVGSTPTNLGVNLGTAPCNATGVPFTVTTVCNQGTTANSFPPTFYDNLEAFLTYQQDDLSSVASWSGAVTLTTVVTPEPATLGLVGLALVFVGGFATRRRNS
jgi:hypothetical protein